MAALTNTLETAKGHIHFPAFLPVTTFGGRYPLDDLVRHYLARFAPALMVSHFYAQKIETLPWPVFIDSGGFASLFKGSQVVLLSGGTFGLKSREGTLLSPQSVLTFQEQHAEIGATLDFVIAPDSDPEEGKDCQDRSVANAKWALAHKKKKDLKLFASIQAWDRASMHRILEKLLPLDFDGFALGGMVPRIRAPKVIFDLVAAFRELDPHRPLHLFGIGVPRLVKALFEYGVSSVDSSNYVRQAISKRYLIPDIGEYAPLQEDLETEQKCACNICRQFSGQYLALEGELNNMALALHNLAATYAYLDMGGCNGSRQKLFYPPEQKKPG